MTNDEMTNDANDEMANYLSAMISPQIKDFLHRKFHFANPDPEVTDKRIIGLFLVGMIMLSAVLYNVLYDALGYPFNWWTTRVYCLATIAGIAWLLYSGNYFFFKHLQFLLFLVLPPVAQIIHGGYTAGSGFVLVSFLAPLGALIFNEWKAARWYFAAFVALQVICGTIEYFLGQPSVGTPHGISVLFFEANFILTTSIVYYLMDRSLRFQASLKQMLLEENEKSEALINNLLPKEVADELKSTGYATAKTYPSATVLFTDFAGFSAFARTLSAEALVKEIDFYFGAFDEIVKRHGLEKIKTIGDSYMCAGGLPTPKSTHVHDTVRAALEIRDFVRRHSEEKRSAFGYAFDMRIGIHTGQVIAGVVGSSKIAYDIWGETVNIASRMERLCEPGEIGISEATHALVKDDFDCSYRGRFPARHIGEVDVFYVNEKISS